MLLFLSASADERLTLAFCIGLLVFVHESTAVPSGIGIFLAPRTDGRCGSAFNNATCVVGRDYGGCCSSNGYCGPTSDYCGAGCQSGCTNGNVSGAHLPVIVNPPQHIVNGRCGSAFNNATCDAGKDYGGCCSSGGYCGPTIDYCGVGCQSGCTNKNISGAHLPMNVSSQQHRTDGRCGSAFNNATCEAGRDYGGCCSSGGYCGPTIDYCGDGCQSGCTGGGGIGPMPMYPWQPRVDGRCGSAFYNATCDGCGPFGGCCSSNGYCGSTSDYCGVGCQSGCGSVGRAAVHSPLTQQTFSNTTTAAPGGNVHQPMPIGAEWFHTSVDTCTTLPKSSKTGCDCFVRASTVELLYFPPATAVSNVSAVSTGPAGSLASILISNGYTFTSPSVYAVYHDVSTDIYCMTARSVTPISRVYDAVTIAYDAKDILINYCDIGFDATGSGLDWRTLNLTELAYPYPNTELASRFGCSLFPTRANSFADEHTIMESALYSLPPGLTSIQADWSTCVVDIFARDPPRTLQPVSALMGPTTTPFAPSPTTVKPGPGIVSPPSPTTTSAIAAVIPVPSVSGLDPMGMIPPKADPKPSPDPSSIPDPGQNQNPKNTIQSPKPSPGQDHQDPKNSSPPTNTDPGQTNLDPNSAHSDPAASTPSSKDPTQGQSNQDPKLPNPSPNAKPEPVNQDPKPSAASPIQVPTNSGADPGQNTHPASDPNPGNGGQGSGHSDPHPDSVPPPTDANPPNVAPTPVVVNGQTPSRLPKATPSPSSPNPPITTPVVIGDQTFSPGSTPVTVAGTVHSIAAPDGNVIVNGQTISHLPIAVPPPSSSHILSIGSQTIPFSVNSASEIVVNSQTLHSDHPIIVGSQTIALNPSATDNGILVNGQPTSLPKPGPPPPASQHDSGRPPITVAGQTITTNEAGNYVYGSQTLQNGGPAITVSGTPVSIAPASQITVGRSTIQLSPIPTTPPSIIAGGHPLTTNSAGDFIIGSSTLHPGSPAIIISNTPISLDASASQLIVGGSTIQLVPALPTPPSLTIGGHPLTTNSAGAYIIGSQTLTPGAPALTISSTPISLAPSGTALVVGSSTIPLSTLSTSQPPLIIGDTTIPYVLDSTASLLIIASHTLTPGGAALTLSNGVVSAVQGAGTQGVEVVVGSGGSTMTEGLGGAIMSAFGTGGVGTPTGSAGAGGAVTSAEGFKGEGGRSGKLRMGVWIGIGVGMWGWGWGWI